MRRKKGPNIKLNNNKRPRCTDKKENNQRSQPTGEVQNNNIDTDTERSIKQNEKESENRQREQPLWRQGASGRHVWDTVRHYNNMTRQAEPNDALQALTAQIPDRGWRLAAGKRSGADGEIGENSDTSNTMTRGEHQSGSNKAASRRAATSRHTPHTTYTRREPAGNAERRNATYWKQHRWSK